MLLKQGAEAELRRIEWHGRPAVEKVRLPKPYRQEKLDDELRKSRLRTEARLMSEARKLGLSVPLLYDVDVAGHRLVMEFLSGATAKDLALTIHPHPTLTETYSEAADHLHGLATHLYRVRREPPKK